METKKTKQKRQTELVRIDTRWHDFLKTMAWAQRKPISKIIDDVLEVFYKMDAEEASKNLFKFRCGTSNILGKKL